MAYKSFFMAPLKVLKDSQVPPVGLVPQFENHGFRLRAMPDAAFVFLLYGVFNTPTPRCYCKLFPVFNCYFL